MSFCGKACQKVAWPGHKKECRRVQREKARVLDKAGADFAADEAMAADYCRADIPKGAECYICLNQTSYGQLRGDLVRGCSCRGPHAGFVHIRCLVKNAEERGEHDDEAYDEALRTCTQCRQDFRGPVAVALWRASWLRFAGRAETDHVRQMALYNLGAVLANMDRLDEALVINEEHLAAMRRLYEPDDFRTILAEEGVARTLRSLGGEENARSAVEMLTRVYGHKLRRCGRNHEQTLNTASSLANALQLTGKFDEA